jgi:hypothetical protein
VTAAFTAAFTAAGTTMHASASDIADDSDDVRGDGSGSIVRVVKKVRGVLVPHGLIPPALAPTEVASIQRVNVAHRWMPDVAAPVRGHPWRGPPVIGAHPPS